MKVRFVSPANIELDEAVRYYDHQLPGLGFRFYQETEILSIIRFTNLLVVCFATFPFEAQRILQLKKNYSLNREFRCL